MIKLKPGVSLKGVQPQIVLAALIVESIYASHSAVCTITSCNDSAHSTDSFHYRGLALDFRTKDYLSDKKQLRDEIAAALGAEFDVLLENEGKDNEHIHVEYDPGE
jgi:hypothetical protein